MVPGRGEVVAYCSSSIHYWSSEEHGLCSRGLLFSKEPDKPCKTLRGVAGDILSGRLAWPSVRPSERP